jgi:hypothetical protein
MSTTPHDEKELRDFEPGQEEPSPSEEMEKAVIWGGGPCLLILIILVIGYFVFRK